MKYLAKGKRGIVFLSKRKCKWVVVKKKRMGSAAIHALVNEAYWLRILNKEEIGPRLISLKGETVTMECIQGDMILQWLEKHRQESLKIKRVLSGVLRQCYLLDKLGVEKGEMHAPVKHIIIRNGKPVLIDFERCKRTLKPGNVTQFCQFLMKLNFLGKEIIPLLKSYKASYDDRSFMGIIKMLNRKIT